MLGIWDSGSCANALPEVFAVQGVLSSLSDFCLVFLSPFRRPVWRLCRRVVRAEVRLGLVMPPSADASRATESEREREGVWGGWGRHGNPEKTLSRRPKAASFVSL